MMKFLIVLIAISVSQCAAECSNQAKTVVLCDSFHDLHNKNEVERKSWTTVKFLSNYKEQLNKNILELVPNFERIFFFGNVNDIANSTFADKSDLSEIVFNKCDLPIIRKNWFVFNSNTKVALSIEESKVISLEPNCFADSKNLFEFRLSDNDITRITINVFNGTLIAKLYLWNNKIEFIEENAFANMFNLVELNLNGNFLTSFNAKLYLNNVPNLLELKISRNKINSVGKNNFVNFSKLYFLNLHSNKIQRIEDGAFNGLTKLETLYLYNNSLYDFRERSFPFNGLPFLVNLRIANNRLNYLPKTFLLLFPNLKKVDLFGNPWQCDCYYDIIKALSNTNVSITCANEYLNGQRPVCVVPRTGNGECVDFIQDPNELYETYTEAMKEYETIKECV